MKVLQVGNSDIIAPGFNGAELKEQLIKNGIYSQHCVWEKGSDNKDTWELICDSKFKRKVGFFVKHIEQYLSVQSILSPFPWKLLFDKRFQSSNIIHYQLIHTGYFNILSLPLLTHAKPSIWTLHDPWALTGHCLHPSFCHCDKWKTGCEKCPDLKTTMAIKKDNTALMWKIKKHIYNMSKIDIVVASKWMFNKAKQSPLLSNFKVHHIPFGLNLNIFRPMDKELAQKEMGVEPGSIVIAFRATTSEFKGLNFIKKALHSLNTNKPVCLLTFDMRGLVDEFRGKYQIIELGWVKDYETTVAAYNACDIFLMPSVAETFGMMAIEAMACGKSVIIFEQTALMEVTGAPYGAISVLPGDSEALKTEIENLINNEDKRIKLGDKALKLVKENYNIDTMVKKHIELYEEVVQKRKKEFRLL